MVRLKSWAMVKPQMAWALRTLTVSFSGIPVIDSRSMFDTMACEPIDQSVAPMVADSSY